MPIKPQTIPPLSIAPMMDKTDRHFRYFMRFITKRTALYTGMITTGAILYGDKKRFLDYDPKEKPLVLQLGGDVPDDLARCVELAEKWNYDEVNFNAGCPSDRVQNGKFGALLMKKPELVADCIKAMKKACNLPVTVKHRIGIDDQNSFDDLVRFVEIVANGGGTHFIVHARIALLKGLSPKENRSKPPLNYDQVYELKKKFPELKFTINGGITKLSEAAQHLELVDGVMIGRAAYDNPYLFADADNLFFNDKNETIRRMQIVREMIPYVKYWQEKGIRPFSIIRHMMGLFYRKKGAKTWRRLLSENASEINFEKILLDTVEKIERVN